MLNQYQIISEEQIQRVIDDIQGNPQRGTKQSSLKWNSSTSNYSRERQQKNKNEGQAIKSNIKHTESRQGGTLMSMSQDNSTQKWSNRDPQNQEAGSRKPTLVNHLKGGSFSQNEKCSSFEQHNLNNPNHKTLLMIKKDNCKKSIKVDDQSEERDAETCFGCWKLNFDKKKIQ